MEVVFMLVKVDEPTLQQYATRCLFPVKIAKIINYC
jgi:hypothetical protein